MQIFAGPFFEAEDIFVLEGWSFLWASRHQARLPEAHAHKQFYMVDNFALAFALTAGRSKDFQMLQICRKSSALRIATRIAPRVLWICSENDPMDKASRVFKNRGPKNHSER